MPSRGSWPSCVPCRVERPGLSNWHKAAEPGTTKASPTIRPHPWRALQSSHGSSSRPIQAVRWDETSITDDQDNSASTHAYGQPERGNSAPHLPADQGRRGYSAPTLTADNSKRQPDGEPLYTTRLGHALTIDKTAHSPPRHTLPAPRGTWRTTSPQRAPARAPRRRLPGPTDL